MIPELEEKFQKLEEVFTETIAFMDAQPSTELNKPIPGKWNAVEILFHLAQSEKGTTLYLGKKILADKKEVASGGIGEKLRSKLLIAALSSKSRSYKAPKLIADMSDCPDYESIKKGMIENRKDLKILMGRFDSTMAKMAYFKHPLAGRINIYHTLDFLSTHFSRHADQIRERSKA